MAKPERDVQSPTDIDALLSTGLEHHRAGNIALARTFYTELLKHRSDNADVLYLLALTYAAQADHAQALSMFARAIELNPHSAAYYSSAGNSYRSIGQHAQADESYRRALALDGDDVDALNEVAMYLVEQGKSHDAIEYLSRATVLAPNDARSFYHLGMAFAQSNAAADAIAAYQRAAVLAPENLDVLINLGAVAHSQCDFTLAKTSFERVIALNPTSVIAHNNLGSALQGLEKVATAIEHFRDAIRLDPQHKNARANLAQSLQEISAYKEAIDAYDEAIAIEDKPARQLRRALVLPIIPASNDEIALARHRTADALDRLRQSNLRIAHPETEVATCNFHLAYHGLNDRDLQVKTAQTYLKLCPTLEWTAPNIDGRHNRTGRVRVGFISRFLRGHSIGKTSRGLIAELNRKEFEVFAVHTAPPSEDSIGTFIRERAEHSVVVPNALDEARRTIAALNLDVLFYQDIGMDPFTYYLAYSRLASVQCVSFGHPDTTGIPNMDWWVSSENFEPEDATDHYSEKLWRAADVGTLAFYYRPDTPAVFKTRSELGLSEHRHIYFCPHTPFRIAPDFDQLLGQILESDPHGDIWLIEGRQPQWTLRLRERMERTLGGNIERVKVLPMQPHTAYLNLMHAADAVLDPIWFNGMNNSLDAFAAGVPVVTLPHLFQRGRHTFGMYKKMQWFDCVARDPSDYAKIAVRLAVDNEFRRQARRAIDERAHVLFEDHQVVREFERFFREAVGR